MSRRVFFAALAAGLVVLSHAGMAMRERELRSAREQTLGLARLLAAKDAQILRATHRLLAGLAELPEIQGKDLAACDKVMGRLLPLMPMYNNLGLISMDGDVVCSSIAHVGPRHAGDRAYFRRALADRDFAVGDFQVGRVTKRHGINFGFPVRLKGGGAQPLGGQVRGVVFAALDLTWAVQLAGRVPPPEGSALVLADRKGRVVARYPPLEKWEGESGASDPLVGRMLSASEGTVELEAADGVRRIYGFARVGDDPLGLRIAVGVSRSAAQSGSRRILAAGLAALVLASAAVAIGLRRAP